MGDYVVNESDSDPEFEALVQQLEAKTTSTNTNDQHSGAMPNTNPSESATSDDTESQDKDDEEDDDAEDHVPKRLATKLRINLRHKDKRIKGLEHQVTAKEAELAQKEAELAWWRKHGNDYDISYQPDPTEVDDDLLAKVDEDDPTALKQTVKLLAKQNQPQTSEPSQPTSNNSWVHHVTDEQVLDTLGLWSEESQEPDDKKAQLRWQYALEAESEILSENKSLSPDEIAKQVIIRTREKMKQGASQKVAKSTGKSVMPESLNSKSPAGQTLTNDVGMLLQQTGKDLWDSL